MSTNNISDNNHHVSHEAQTNELYSFGFWLFILTDIILFATLFAAFIVLGSHILPDAFNMKLVLVETIALLTSSLTFGLAYIFASAKKTCLAVILSFITLFLGILFIYLEVSEFAELISEGKSWDYHAYYSAFFVLLGTHGLHVFIGICWLIIILIQVFLRGFDNIVFRKFTLLGLFWHFLDAVWIFVFSIVYLVGAI